MFSDDEEMKYQYFSIITNDEDTSEEDIIKYYNKRGSIEREWHLEAAIEVPINVGFTQKNTMDTT